MQKLRGHAYQGASKAERRAKQHKHTVGERVPANTPGVKPVLANERELRRFAAIMNRRRTNVANTPRHV